MNKYDELFEFRVAKYNDIDKIMRFISDYWGKPNHILATDRTFFEYEFCHGNEVGFYLAIEKTTKNIMAVNAIYYYSKEYVENDSDISGGMFLANPNCKVPFIGAELLKREFNQLRPRSYVSPGVNIKTAGPVILKLLRQNVERMKHYYILSDKEEYVIASINRKVFDLGKDDDNHYNNIYLCETIEDLNDNFDFAKSQNRKPYKDQWYIGKRYYKHPYYQYKLYAINEKMVIVGREISVNGSTVFRIVDILGDVTLIEGLRSFFRKLIIKHNYEYIDLYEIGIDDKLLLNAGFDERTEDDKNIIPNYFEPFVQCNVEIYAHRMDADSLCFKADGDQDRPNVVY